MIMFIDLFYGYLLLLFIIVIFYCSVLFYGDKLVIFSYCNELFIVVRLLDKNKICV